MDTDSAYMAISEENLEDVIKPELLVEFYDNYHCWFPAPFCDEHRKQFIFHGISKKKWEMKTCCSKRYKRETRTPGLFKEEFKGDGIVALNSKTYFCWKNEDEEKKYSSKGLSKHTNKLSKKCYLDVLKTGKPKLGVNKGFIKKDNSTFTYSQIKTGLTYFYAKRLVHEDGVSTSNISC